MHVSSPTLFSTDTTSAPDPAFGPSTPAFHLGGPALLAATSDSGVLLHDIIGIGAMLVLVVLGIVLYRRQPTLAGQGRGEGRVGDSRLDRQFARLQVWMLYAVAVAAAITFFFIIPRATRTEGKSSKHQNAGSKKLP